MIAKAKALRHAAALKRTAAQQRAYDAECERIIDHRAVRHFAAAMIVKLDKKRAQGRAGWHDPERCTVEELLVDIARHFKKGDMVDIANLAMMVWHRQRTAAKAAA